jgi:predicted ATPase/class 3 adenylate cyclase
MPDLPTGTVTFLFSDIEGSTRLVQQLGARYAKVLAEHRALLRAAFAAHNGHEIGTEGDSFFVVFARAREAVAAALAAQRSLAAHPWPEGAPVRVRMGLHSGEGNPQDGGYVGLDVHRAARVAAAAHGGQVLLSRAAQELARDALPEGAGLRDLGEHRLKDLARPERLFQLVAPGLPADFPPLKSPTTLRNNLPAQLTSFIGREREIAGVKRLLARSRLLTLTGAGGAGKTRLALQVAADLAGDCADGVWLVELAPLPDSALVVQTMAATFRLQEAPGRTLMEVLIAHLAPKRALLLLDNCEHLVAACAEVAETLLRACPRLRILATSRELLGCAGEVAWRVPSLSLPDPEQIPTAEDLTSYEAPRLFIDRAAAALPSFVATDRNAPAIAEICRRLDGIPLAIELAAARVKMFSAEQIAARLNDRFQLLTSGNRTVLPRQQTLRALVDWSYDLLAEPERMLLRRLSVFAGGCTFEAAETVAAGAGIEPREILDLLGRLVDKSLVVAEPDTKGAIRYRMLETIRAYAQEKLGAAGEATDLRDRQLAFYVQLAERAEPGLRGPEQTTWLELLKAERTNLRAALSWSHDRDLPAGLQLAGALWWYWYVSGYVSEGFAALETLIGVARQVAAPEDAPIAGVPSGIAAAVWGRALRGVAALAARHGALERATAFGEEALGLARALDEPRNVAVALFVLGAVAQGRGDYDQAIALLEESAARSRQVGEEWSTAVALVLLGEVASNRGNFEQAATLYEQSLAIFRRFGDKFGVAYVLNGLGTAARRHGDQRRAQELLEVCLALYRELGQKSGVASALGGLGALASRRGDYDRAAELLAESLALFRAQEEKSGASFALLLLGMVGRGRGDHVGALDRLQESLALRAELGERRGAAECLAAIGGVIVDAATLSSAPAGRAAGAARAARLERAARLLGAAGALTRAIGARAPTADRPSYRRDLDTARALLGGARFHAAWERGRALSFEEAVREGLGIGLPELAGTARDLGGTGGASRENSGSV